MDQKVVFRGTVGYGASYLEFSFRHFNVIRLQAKLTDAAGAVSAHSGKGPGHRCMIRGGPSSCLPCHMAELLF